MCESFDYEFPFFDRTIPWTLDTPNIPAGWMDCQLTVDLQQRLRCLEEWLPKQTNPPVDPKVHNHYERQKKQIEQILTERQIGQVPPRWVFPDWDITDLHPPCSSCGVLEGMLHQKDCEEESCRICGQQWITCGCQWKLVGFDYDRSQEFCGLPERIYRGEVTPEENAAFDAQVEVELEKRGGRVPYILYPPACARCGRLLYREYMVEDEVWQRYIEPAHQNEGVCWECFGQIRQLIDSAGKVQTLSLPFSSKEGTKNV